MQSNRIRRISKIALGLFLLAWGTAIFVGCSTEDKYILVKEDTPPAVPLGLYSVTGDEQVFLYWYANSEDDLNFYVIYRSPDDNVFSEIGKVYPDQDVIFVDNNVTNGTTYYYAITAVDDAMNESDLSPESVYDTPRPEGYGVRVYDYNQQPAASGFEFSRHHVVDGGDQDADVYYDYYINRYGQGAFYINVANALTDLQDFGYTESMDDVGWAPDEGWSQLGYSELILGHSYIIWTQDDHYAKIRITQLNVDGGWISFDWAYQTSTDGQMKHELKIMPKQVPPRAPGYGDKTYNNNGS